MKNIINLCKKDFPLRKLNTFGIDVKAKYYVKLSDTNKIIDLFREIQSDGIEFLILGEGSNILFTEDFDGIVIHNTIHGRVYVYEDKNHVVIKVGAGENWDDFVAFCVKMNFGGLENLSLIPGSVGSSPVQNIGAYGVEIKDRIIRVEGYSLPKLEFTVLENEACRFSYRNSIFKNELKNRYLITAVILRLDKHPVFELKYGEVEELFRNKMPRNLKTLRETIIDIRNRKLPDPLKFGNAGSFFKNPVVSGNHYALLRNRWSDIPGYTSESGSMKIPAAWLIEKAGWKGVREGDTGTWNTQPLVIVNYGCASGRDILNFSEKIRKSVFENYGIELEREVNIVGG